MKLTVAYEFLPKKRSLHTSFVMDHFGVDFEQGRHVVAQDVELDIRPGDVVLFTGPSGSGKSSLLRESVRALERESATVVWIDKCALPEKPLVDALPLPIKEGMDVLAACGLSEAQLLLRTPSELSDGQRYRFRIAMGIARLGTGGWLVADEFSANLDRTLAKVLAFNLRRLATRTGIGFLLATTHQDIIADLAPDILVRCDLDGTINVCPTPRADGRTRRAIRFFPTSGSAKAPRPIGRTSLGGITAATTCAWSGG